MVKFKDIRNNIKKYFKLFKSLYKDKRTPKISKIFLWLAIINLISPFDIIPDFIPLIGWLDDIIIIPLSIFLAIKTIPRDLYRKHYEKIFYHK